MGFQRSAILKIDITSFSRGWYDLNKISQTGAEWHVDSGDMVKIETISCTIPIWRTFGRNQWHVIPEPHATLQGVKILSAILKIVFRHILFYFCFFFQCSLGFNERRLSYRLRYNCWYYGNILRSSLPKGSIKHCLRLSVRLPVCRIVSVIC